MICYTFAMGGSPCWLSLSADLGNSGLCGHHPSILFVAGMRWLHLGVVVGAIAGNHLS